MSLSVVTNVGSLVASNELTNNQTALNETIAQLSSGKRIVNAQDDPGDLVLATEEQGLIGAFGKAQSNTANATLFLQTADGALSNIANLLQTAQQLATEASDGSFSSSQLTALNSQFQAILNSVRRSSMAARSTARRCCKARRSPSRSGRPTRPTTSSRSRCPRLTPPRSRSTRRR